MSSVHVVPHISFDDATLVCSKDAARTVNLAPDYVSRLARENLHRRQTNRRPLVRRPRLSPRNSLPSRIDNARSGARISRKKRREEQRLAGHPSALLARTCSPTTNSIVASAQPRMPPRFRAYQQRERMTKLVGVGLLSVLSASRRRHNNRESRAAQRNLPGAPNAACTQPKACNSRISAQQKPPRRNSDARRRRRLRHRPARHTREQHLQTHLPNLFKSRPESENRATTSKSKSATHTTSSQNVKLPKTHPPAPTEGLRRQSQSQRRVRMPPHHLQSLTTPLFNSSHQSASHPTHPRNRTHGGGERRERRGCRPAHARASTHYSQSQLAAV